MRALERQQESDRKFAELTDQGLPDGEALLRLHLIHGLGLTFLWKTLSAHRGLEPREAMKQVVRATRSARFAEGLTSKLPKRPVNAYILSGEFDFSAPISRPGYLRSSDILVDAVVDEMHSDHLRSIITAPDTFGGEGLRCFIPRFGFTLGAGERSTDILICIECYQVYVFRHDARENQCLTEEGRQRFIELHHEIFPDHDPEPGSRNR